MKILVLVDGSMWGHKAAVSALPIAKRKNAEVVFLTVLDRMEAKSAAFNFCVQSDMCDRLHNYEEQIWRDMKKSINTEIVDIMRYYNIEEVECSKKIVEGDTKEVIVQEANNGDYTLVVMGAYGKSAIKLGSLVTELPYEVRPPIMILH